MWGFGRVNKQASQPVKKQQEVTTSCSLELIGDLIGHSSSVEVWLPLLVASRPVGSGTAGAAERSQWRPGVGVFCYLVSQASGQAVLPEPCGGQYETGLAPFCLASTLQGGGWAVSSGANRPSPTPKTLCASLESAKVKISWDVGKWDCLFRCQNSLRGFFPRHISWEQCLFRADPCWAVLLNPCRGSGPKVCITHIC